MCTGLSAVSFVPSLSPKADALGEIAQLAKRLLCKYESLSSSPNTLVKGAATQTARFLGPAAQPA